MNRLFLWLMFLSTTTVYAGTLIPLQEKESKPKHAVLITMGAKENIVLLSKQVTAFKKDFLGYTDNVYSYFIYARNRKKQSWKRCPKIKTGLTSYFKRETVLTQPPTPISFIHAVDEDTVFTLPQEQFLPLNPFKTSGYQLYKGSSLGWHHILTLQEKPVRISGATLQHIWITTTHGDKQKSLHLNHIDGVIDDEKPYHTVSVGYDETLWAVSSDRKSIIYKEHASSETETLYPLKIYNPQKERPEIAYIYTHDKNNIYAVDSNDYAYMWSTHYHQFLLLDTQKRFRSIASQPTGYTLMLGVDNSAYYWSETDEQRAVRENETMQQQLTATKKTTVTPTLSTELQTAPALPIIAQPASEQRPATAPENLAQKVTAQQTYIKKSVETLKELSGQLLKEKQKPQSPQTAVSETQTSAIQQKEKVDPQKKPSSYWWARINALQNYITQWLRTSFFSPVAWLFNNTKTNNTYTIS